MPVRTVAIGAEIPSALTRALEAIRTKLAVPADFPADVLDSAEAAARQPRLPDLDRTDLELITIDPEGARDLDQALHLAADSSVAAGPGRPWPCWPTWDACGPADAAMLNACTMLFRGVGYRAFRGSIPDDVEHAALAIDYAHVTAPLRRRADRYASEICVALCADSPVPAWVVSALDALPAEMQAAEQRARKYERAILDLAEVFVLAGRTRDAFTGTVVEVDPARDRGLVMIKDPAVAATVTGADLPLGREIDLRLVSAGLGGRRTVRARLTPMASARRSDNR